MFIEPVLGFEENLLSDDVRRGRVDDKRWHGQLPRKWFGAEKSLHKSEWTRVA
jgi:hypothetical protein